MSADWFRYVETPDGPAVQIPAGGARLVHAHLGRLLSERPAGVPSDPVLLPLARLCALVEQAHEAGRGFTRETTSEDDPSSLFTTPRGVADVLGISVQAVTAGCRLDRYPGAVQVDGRWLIPLSALENEDTDDAAA